MTKAILYKEWIKTRFYFIALMVLSLGFTIYTLMKMGRVVSFKGADHIWAIMLTRDNTFIEQVSYLPLLCGIVIAISQFMPEMVQKRLKLTLHLPYPQSKMILFMLISGLLELTVIFLLQIAIISIYSLRIVPTELLERMLLTSTPWFMSGFITYLFTSSICMEPTWKMRIVNILILCGVTRIFYLSDTPEAYNDMIGLFAILILFAFTLSFRSVIRFKEGCQD